MLALMLFLSTVSFAKEFAQLNDAGEVVNVIVADDEFIKSQKGTFVEYDTKGIVSKTPAGIGMVFDKQRKAFLPKKPFPSWKLNEKTFSYDPPTPQPESKDLPYVWNETDKTWEVSPEQKPAEAETKKRQAALEAENEKRLAELQEKIADPDQKITEEELREAVLLSIQKK